MPVLKKRRRQAEQKLVWLSVGEIRPNPVQPRRCFPETGLEELAQSIAQHGILQPLTVRLRGRGYELVAGERRLRAAKMVGLELVPCLVSEINMEESGVLALVENLQRRDLSFVEEAEGISRLIKMFGLSQEEVARRLGKSQSAIANKLRLLRLPSDVLETLCAEGLTERHGRALLRLENAQLQREALGRMVELGMNVAAAENYVDALLCHGGRELPPPELEAPASAPEPEAASVLESDPGTVSLPPAAAQQRKRTFVMKDVRLFMNTLTRSLEVMKQGGIQAAVDRQDTDTDIVLTIRIEKRDAK